DKAITLQSVNGPDVTIIQGYQMPGVTNGDAAIRCVYLAERAVLSGFTLTQGATRQGGGPWGGSPEDSSGGGVWCLSGAQVTSCKLIGNSGGRNGGGAAGGSLHRCTLTGNSANEGGGAYGGILNNCLLTGNSANRGGGAFASEVNNCTVTGNSAIQQGGGVLAGGIYNSILYYNNAPTDPNWVGSKGGIITFCCTTPLPAPENWHNIEAEPRFVSLAGGDFRLQADSPCINAGSNAYAPSPTDLDGKPRVVEGTVDIGAYEFQDAGSALSYAWLQQYDLPADGSADNADPDNDGMNNRQEWICGTCPTNALSALRLLSAAPAGSNVAVTWQSVPSVKYFVERSTIPGSATPLESTNSAVVATNLLGDPGTTTFIDTNAAATGPFFYRVGAQFP
ncbi:MAG TPA: choice-of-anchor Q domain-containing protein, partial [Clostridia bacterium]|nr:choice-of-anchor Q domain-containing protein [Clostridia bacterium]